jgi:SAM-dependent methyltransferase
VTELGLSFDAVAVDYERHRPEYPAPVLDWLGDRIGIGPGKRVLDLGAGTGKLTRGLVQLGADVVAVEPGAQMLDQLRAAVPQAEALQGSAEAIPLPDGSLDVVVAGQAYHWFDLDRALPELHRVLRPSGRLALLWIWWDLRDPRQQRLVELLDRPPRVEFGRLPEPPSFVELESAVLESVRTMTPEDIVGRISTSSAAASADPEARRALLESVNELVSTYGEQFDMPQLTHVYGFSRSGS